MRRLRALTALVLLLLGMAACSDDEPDPRDPSTTWSPTGTMETPSSTATAVPTEPPLPDAARQASEEGARAFIAYYWDLVNYAQVTGDVKALKAVSGRTCEGCQKGITAVVDLWSSGGRAEGGEYELTIENVKSIRSSEKSFRGAKARYEVRNAEQSILRADGRREVIQSGTTSYLSYLIWIDGHWRADVLEPR